MKFLTSDQFLRLVLGLEFKIIKRNNFGDIQSIFCGMGASFFNGDNVEFLVGKDRVYYVININKCRFHLRQEAGNNVVQVIGEDFELEIEFFKKTLKEVDIEEFLKED